MKGLCLVLVFVALVAADKIPDFVVKGQCPIVDTEGLWRQQKPIHNRYAGIWYMQALTNNPYMPIKKCTEVEFKFDGQGFEGKTTGIDIDGNLKRMDGKLYPNPLGVPVLTIDYQDVWASPYTILDTDYENYACVYSCIDYNYGYFSDFAFIKSRSPTMSQNYMQKCKKVFEDLKIDTKRFISMDQGSSCPYDTQRLL